MLKSKHRILLMMSGSIAGYKACHVISQLTQKGNDVQVVATPQTLNFIGPTTIEGLTGKPLLSDAFAISHAMDHIHLARWADLIIVCPATANTINKMAHGIADDLVNTLFLAHDFTKPFLVAPAMNTAMYQHPITQKSLKLLESLGVVVLPTDAGNLACGEVGAGRLLEPDKILKVIEENLKKIPPRPNNDTTKNDIAPTTSKPKILITSGGTQEPIDSMRVLSNLSSGETGAFLADALFDEGFEICYLGATTAKVPQRPCQKYTFKTFNELNTRLEELLKEESFWAVIHAAAVSDFHISKIQSGEATVTDPSGKLASDQPLTIELKPNFKILPRIKSYAKAKPPLVIGFKFTATDQLQKRVEAIEKLFSEGGVDLVVHNDISDIDKSKSQHRFTLFTGTKSIPLPHRQALALALIDHLNLKGDEL